MVRIIHLSTVHAFPGITGQVTPRRHAVYASNNNDEIIENVIIVQGLTSRKDSTLPSFLLRPFPVMLSLHAATSYASLFARAGADPPSP
jgi:hypothetical protein